MQAVLGTFFFFVLLRTGSSMECEVCTGVGGSCTGTMRPCLPGQDTCAIVVAENTLAGTAMQTVVKSCQPSNVCNLGPVYMNFGQGQYVHSSTTCCEGDDCKTISPQIPSAVTKRNGKQCKGCYSYSPLGCASVTVDCLEDEDHCLHMVEEIKYGKFSFSITMKGCVTKNVCTAHEGQTVSADFQGNVVKISCTPALVAA